MNEKKIAIIAVLAIAVAVMLLVLIASSDEIKTDKNLVGENYKITYKYVNVREDSNVHSAIITTIYFGEEVVLTGRYYDIVGDSQTDTSRWVEIQMEDGKTGWIVRASGLVI